MSRHHVNPPLLKLTAASILAQQGLGAGAILALLKSDAQSGAAGG